MDPDAIWIQPLLSASKVVSVSESADVVRARARYASMIRYRQDGDHDRVAAARDYAELLLTQHIQTVMAKFPPFTNAQRNRLMALLLAG